MVIYVAIDAHFVRCRGEVFTEISFPYAYWREYLDVFQEVRPVARLVDAAAPPAGWQRADGPGVRFVAVRDYLGFWSFLRNLPRVLLDCRDAVRRSEALLLRWGLVALSCWAWTRIYRKPYAFEFTSDSGESLRPVKNIQTLGFNNLLVHVAQWLSRRVARGAVAVSYVSRFVQTLYPSRRREREWVFSGVQLKQGLITAPRPPDSFLRRGLRLVCVGRLEPEKGQGVLIEAVRQLAAAGHAVSAICIGPGREHDHLAAQIAALGLAERVTLAGRVEWGPALWRLLDDGDLFVLPSLTEGMPRALIEAMARGLPAVGTRAGGIPELLPPEQLVAPGDAAGLAECILRTAASREALAALSARLFARALEYEPENMLRRKHAFWNCLRDDVLRRAAIRAGAPRG